MRWLAKLSLRLRSLLRKPTLDRELDEELQYHLERQIEENIAAGMDPTTARQAARRDFGGVAAVEEECRDMRGVTLAHDLISDVRYGARMIRKHPGFTTVAVVTLALGIGATTAIFSFIDAVLLRTLPVTDPDSLVVLRWHARTEPDYFNVSTYGDCSGIDSTPASRTPAEGPGAAGCSFSLPFFRELAADRNLFARVAAYANAPPLLVSGHGPPAMGTGQLVSGDFFGVLGVRAVLGRTLEPDDEPRAAPVVVLHHAYWKRAFGGDPAVIGKTVTLNGVAFTIVGVAEPRFTRLTPGTVFDMWMPLSVRRLLMSRWDPRNDQATSWWLAVIGRLRPDLSEAQAAAALSLRFHHDVVGGTSPLLNDADDPQISLARAPSGLIGERVRYAGQLRVLMLAVGIVLLIACANVAGLLLARGAARRRELAVRLAMGAGRGRIIRKLLTESLLLAAIGGALGAALAVWGVDAMATFVQQSQSRPLGFEISVDARVLAFTTALSVAVGLAFGLAPAFRGTRLDLAATLRDGAGGSAAARSARRRLGLGNALVVAQVALSILVLVGAGLLVRTLDKLRGVDPGFQTQNVLLFGLNPSLARYQPRQIDELYRELRRQLDELPGVQSASWAEVRLLSGMLWRSTLRPIGPRTHASMDVDVMGVGPEFFATLGVTLLAGRTLSGADIDAAAEAAASVADALPGPPPGVAAAVVNEEFVRRYFPGQNPLGERFEYQSDEPSPTWEIVGVVRNIKYNDLRRDVQPTVYLAATGGGVSFAVRTEGDPAALAPAVTALVARLAPTLPVTDLKTQSDEVEHLLYRERLMAGVSSLFAVIALLLACIGLYALLSYDVARRTREVGIRMALGAQRGDVQRMVVRQGLALTAAGIVLGLAGAAAGTRFLASLLYGVATTDPVVLAGVCALLVVVAFAACYLPARRATRVDPMVALRSE